MSTALTVPEQADLERLEDTINHGLQTFVEVGVALAEIRDRRLYRESHNAFEDYCRERWEMSRAHAYRLIEGAATVSTLSPVGDKLPTSERQVRPLVALEPEDRQRVWERAVATAEKKDEPIYIRHVEEARLEMAPRDMRKEVPSARKAEEFERKMATLLETCRMAGETDVPSLPEGRARELIAELRGAARSVYRLRKKMEERCQV